MLKDALLSFFPGKKRPSYGSKRDYSKIMYEKMLAADMGDDERELEHFELIKEMMLLWARKHDLLNW